MNGSGGSPDFDVVAREVAAGILHFLERQVGNRAVAEELLQETLLRMNRGLSTFAGRSSVKTWAFAIARRVAADHLRRPDCRVGIVPMEEIEEPVDRQRLQEERLVVDEMNRCVRDVIDSLPEPYRAALVLRDLEGLTVEETAEVCDCSLATAKIRIHRARGRLRQALEQECNFYHDGEHVLRCDRKRKGDL